MPLFCAIGRGVPPWVFSVHVAPALDVGFHPVLLIREGTVSGPKSGDTFLDEITFNFPISQRRKKKAVC